MSDAPWDILRYFDAEDDELELHEVFVQGEQPDPGGWIEISGDHRRLDATMLVLLWRRGVKRIAVQYEDRTVEFDLYDVLLRDKPLVGSERT